jgi:hypothetical protein
VLGECGAFNGITELYSKCLLALTTVTKENETLIVLRMFLKLTLILMTAKRVLSAETLVAWQQQNHSSDRLI